MGSRFCECEKYDCDFLHYENDRDIHLKGENRYAFRHKQFRYTLKMKAINHLIVEKLSFYCAAFRKFDSTFHFRVIIL